MNNDTYITLGIDADGCVYGLELEEDGSWRRNSLGASTSCAVIRPVGAKELSERRTDSETVLEDWKMAVADNATQLGLDEYFQQWLEECGSGEDYPGKDASWVYELLEDPGNPALEAFQEEAQGLQANCEECSATRCEECDKVPGWMADSTEPVFRDKVDWLVCNETDFGLGDDQVGTWEADGWYPPSCPFVVELAPREVLDEYYEHLAKWYPAFRKDKVAK